MNERERKLEVAKVALGQILEVMKEIEENIEYDINFCWDECIWVDDEFFNFSDLR